MKESEYVLACNIKSCRAISSELNEMILDDIHENARQEALKIIIGIGQDLMQNLEIEDD